MEYTYIYNKRKADFFIMKGATMLQCGFGNSGQRYYKFKKDENLLKITQNWKETMEFIQKIKK